MLSMKGCVFIANRLHYHFNDNILHDDSKLNISNI